MKKIILLFIAFFCALKAAEPLALVSTETGRVQTFVRPDLPAGWTPPEGYALIARDQLPEGWEMEKPAVAIPAEVTRRQLFLWLNAQGRTRAQIRAMLEANPDAQAREAALIEFDEAQSFKRDHPLIAQLAAALGYTEAQLDAGWLAASKL